MKKTVFIIILLLMVCCTTYAFAKNEVFNISDIINCGLVGLSIGALCDLIGFIICGK